MSLPNEQQKILKKNLFWLLLWISYQNHTLAVLSIVVFPEITMWAHDLDPWSRDFCPLEAQRVGQEDLHFLRILIYVQSHPNYLRHCDHLCFTLQNPLYLLCLHCSLSHSLLMAGEHFCPNSVGFPVLSLIIDMSLDSTVFPGLALPWLGVQNPPIRDMQIVHLHTM